jgi:hypothetical protein
LLHKTQRIEFLKKRLRLALQALFLKIRFLASSGRWYFLYAMVLSAPNQAV